MKINDRLNHALDAYEEALRAAVRACRELKHAARASGFARLAGEIDAYTLGHLAAFLTDEDQPGSLPSIEAGLSEEE